MIFIVLLVIIGGLFFGAFMIIKNVVRILKVNFNLEQETKGDPRWRYG